VGATIVRVKKPLALDEGSTSSPWRYRWLAGLLWLWQWGLCFLHFASRQYMEQQHPLSTAVSPSDPRRRASKKMEEWTQLHACCLALLAACRRRT